jgi:hypothetical protein
VLPFFDEKKVGYNAVGVVLEYCDKTILLEREQFYLGMFEPEYNILKVAGNSLGFRHSRKTKELMSKVTRGDGSNPLSGTNRLEETKDKISRSLGTTINLYSLDLELIQCFASARRGGGHSGARHATITRYAKSAESIFF